MSIARLLVISLVAFASVISAASLLEVVRVEQGVRSVGAFHTPALTALLRIESESQLMIQEALAYLHTRSEDDLQEYTSYSAGVDDRLAEFARIAKLDLPEEANERAMFERIVAQIDAAKRQANTLFALKFPGPEDHVDRVAGPRAHDEAFLSAMEQFERDVDELNLAVSQLERVEMMEVEDAHSLAIATMNDAKISLVFICLLALGGAITLGMFLARQIADPIRRLERSAERVQQGEKELVSAEGPREVVRLATRFNEMADAIVARRQQLEAEIEERAARYRTLVEHAPEAIVVFDTEVARFVDVNAVACTLFKMSRDELLQSDPISRSPEFQPDGRRSSDRVSELFAATLDGETPVFEWTHEDAMGNQIPCEVRLVRLPSSQGVLIRGSVTDISERKAIEARQTLMLRELDHRVKNNLAIIQTLFDQSLNDAHSLAECRVAFSGRIQAMAKTHEALAAEHWTGINLDRTLRMVLDPYITTKDRITISGADVSLTSRMANPFGLAVHELATNAAKYGSLSSADGCVDVKWSCDEDDSIRLHWTERGGPNVSPPGEAGFGLRLVKGLVEHQLGGQVNLAFESDGLVCDMVVPRSA